MAIFLPLPHARSSVIVMRNTKDNNNNRIMKTWWLEEFLWLKCRIKIARTQSAKNFVDVFRELENWISIEDLKFLWKVRVYDIRR